MENAPAVAAPVVSIQPIPLDQLKPNPWNRTVFDPQKIEELAASIKEGGVREPLIIRPCTDGSFQIASGHRRWLASQKVGLKDVPCVVQGLTDQQVSEMDLVDNIQREDIAPLEMARMVQAHIDQFKITQDQAAQKFGKSRPWVTELVSFLAMPGELLANVKALTLGWIPLRALKRLSEEQQKQIAQELEGSKLKPEGVEKRCRQLRSGNGEAKGAGGTEGAEGETAVSQFKFSRVGSQIKITGVFESAGGNLEGFLRDLRTAYLAWNLNDKPMPPHLPPAPHPPQAPTSPTTPRFPQTPADQAELEAIAAGSPGPEPVYAWIFGPGSPMTEAVQKMSWADLQVKDGQEGLPKILDALKKFWLKESQV